MGLNHNYVPPFPLKSRSTWWGRFVPSFFWPIDFRKEHYYRMGIKKLFKKKFRLHYFKFKFENIPIYHFKWNIHLKYKKQKSQNLVHSYKFFNSLNRFESYPQKNYHFLKNIESKVYDAASYLFYDYSKKIKKLINIKPSWEKHRNLKFDLWFFLRDLGLLPFKKGYIITLFNYYQFPILCDIKYSIIMMSNKHKTPEVNIKNFWYDNFINREMFFYHKGLNPVTGIKLKPYFFIKNFKKYRFVNTHKFYRRFILNINIKKFMNKGILTFIGNTYTCRPLLKLGSIKQKKFYSTYIKFLKPIWKGAKFLSMHRITMFIYKFKKKYRVPLLPISKRPKHKHNFNENWREIKEELKELKNYSLFKMFYFSWNLKSRNKKLKKKPKKKLKPRNIIIINTIYRFKKGVRNRFVFKWKRCFPMLKVYRFRMRHYKKLHMNKGFKKKYFKKYISKWIFFFRFFRRIAYFNTPHW
jgi:hypothetical protein